MNFYWGEIKFEKLRRKQSPYTEALHSSQEETWQGLPGSPGAGSPPSKAGNARPAPDPGRQSTRCAAAKPARRSQGARVPESASELLKTTCPEPVLRNKKSRPKEKPAHNQREEPPLTATRGSDPAQPKGSKERKSKCDRKLEIHTRTLPYDYNAKTETKGLVWEKKTELMIKVLFCGHLHSLKIGPLLMASLILFLRMENNSWCAPLFGGVCLRQGEEHNIMDQVQTWLYYPVVAFIWQVCLKFASVKWG